MNCLTCGSVDETFKLEISGKLVWFEWSNALGPMPVTAAGNGRSRVPKAFWEAVTLWCKQGKPLDARGYCTWEEEPDPLEGAVHIGGRHWVMPSKGDA